MTGQRCFVRVTGTREERFVEFEFAIGDPELAVELVMQFEQFREFCMRHGATHLTPQECARLDYERWTPHVVPGGTLCIHDVFADPADGGQAPHDHIYRPALESGRFTEVAAVGSLRVLRRG